MESGGGAQAIGSATALWSRVAGDGSLIEGMRSASLTSPPPPPLQRKVFGHLNQENPGMMSGGARPAASWPAPPSREGRVPLAQMEDKRSAKSAGTGAASSSAPPSRQSRVALRADRAPNEEEKGRSKSGSTHVDASETGLPLRQKRATLSCKDPLIQDKSGGTQSVTISMTKRGGAHPAASSLAPPSRRADRTRTEEKRRAKSAGTRQSGVASCADRAQKEDTGRTMIGNTQVATPSTARPPRQSSATMSCNGPLIQDMKMRKSGGTHLRADRIQTEDKKRAKSAGTRVAASSAPPSRQSRVALRADRDPKEDKGITKIGCTQVSTSSMVLPPRRGRVALLPNGFPVDGIARAEVLKFYTHRDGAIYRRIANDSLARMYRLDDTSETGLEPMMRSERTDYCSPNWMSCNIHDPSTMMQIFSLKLAYPPAGDQVQLYGFFAVRDSLDPLRNYVFNRSRDDPLIVEREDGLIQMSGPKRGIYWHDMALVEFDMRIKRGEKEADDLQLIDGAVWFHEATSTHARVATQRIDGDYGSVDMCYTLLYSAMEATVQIEVAELLGGFSLCATAFYISGLVHQQMKLFDGVIPGPDGCQIYELHKSVIGNGGQIEDDPRKYRVCCRGCQCPRYEHEPEKTAVAAGGGVERYELGNYVIAFPMGTQLGLKLIICQSGGSSQVKRFCISPASTHGDDSFDFDLCFATIHVKITWSTLPPR